MKKWQKVAVGVGSGVVSILLVTLVIWFYATREERKPEPVATSTEQKLVDAEAKITDYEKRDRNAHEAKKEADRKAEIDGLKAQIKELKEAQSVSPAPHRPETSPAVDLLTKCNMYFNGKLAFGESANKAAKGDAKAETTRAQALQDAVGKTAADNRAANAETKAADALKALQDAEARFKTAEAQVETLNAEVGSLKEEMASASAKAKDLARNIASDNPFCSRDQLEEAKAAFQNLSKEFREKLGLLDKTVAGFNRVRAEYISAVEAAKAANVASTTIEAFECPTGVCETPPRGRIRGR